MIDQRSRSKLIDVVEQRRAQRFEFREDKLSGNYILEGYAATYEPYDVYGGPRDGGWVEQLRADAFDRTLGTTPDVMLLVNHEGTPLARTKSGTLQLSRDQHGLRVHAQLDPSDPDVQALAPKMLRKDMDEMSFAFRVKDQSWDDSYTHRTINEVSLHKGDVSVVNYGMNPGTRAALSAGAVGALAALSNDDMLELRKLDQGELQRAFQTLGKVVGGEFAIRAGDPKKPYGDVKYADPGYQKDGKKRYPLDTKAHVKSAWSYINMPKNQKGYSAAQVATIKGRIKSRAKELGINISEDQKSAEVSYIDAVRNTSGGTTLWAVMTDGSRVALPASIPTPDDSRGSAFTGGGMLWNPFSKPADPHEESYNKEELQMDDDEECQEAKSSACTGGSDCPGDSCPTHGSGSDTQEASYDPLTGDGVVRQDDEDNEPPGAEEPEPDDKKEFDAIAAALDQTISHAYKLAEGNSEMRGVLSRARSQLNTLRGKPEGNGEVARMLEDLHRESGVPDTGTVTGYLDYLRNEGSAPVGYRGLLTAPDRPFQSVEDLAARIP